MLTLGLGRSCYFWVVPLLWPDWRQAAVVGPGQRSLGLQSGVGMAEVHLRDI